VMPTEHPRPPSEAIRNRSASAGLRRLSGFIKQEVAAGGN
jgi:hypothetical protein